MISKDTVEFLRRVGEAGKQARFTGRDALRFVDLRRAGLVDAADVVNEETWPDIIVVTPLVTDAGVEALAEFDAKSADGNRPPALWKRIPRWLKWLLATVVAELVRQSIKLLF